MSRADVTVPAVPVLPQHEPSPTAAVSVVTAASRGAGFLRTVLLVHVLGATTLADTYTATNALPTALFELLAGGAIAGAVVPVLAAGGRGTLGPGRPAAAMQARTVSTLLTWTVLLLVPVAVLLLVLRHPLAVALVGGPGRRADVGAVLLAFFAPQVVLYGLAAVAAGVLQARLRLLAAAAAPLVSTVVVVAGYLGFQASGSPRGVDSVSAAGLAVLGGATTAGVVALTATVLFPALRASSQDGALRPALRLPAADARRLRGLLAAGVTTAMAQQVAVLAALRLAAGEPGGVVDWTLAWTVLLVPWAVLVLPVVNRCYPELVAAPDRAATLLAAALARVRGLALVAAGLLAGCAGPLARLLLAGAPGTGPAPLARAFAVIALVLPGYAVSSLLVRALWARAEGASATRGAATGWAVAVVADVALVALAPPGWTPAALAGGTAAGVLTGVVLLARRLQSAGLPVQLVAGGARPFAAALAALLLAGVVSRLTEAWTPALATLTAAAAGGTPAVIVLCSVPSRVRRRRAGVAA